MISRFSRQLVLSGCLLAGTPCFAQTTEVTAKPDDEFAARPKETKLQEVVSTDSLPPDALMKRAVWWIKQENPKYRKSGGTTSGNKAECIATFPVKPKQLNPEVDYTGKITMKVVIECKNSRYRYTVSDIRHDSKNGRTTAGSVDNVVPECGSVAMHDQVWKKLKGEALRDAALVVADLKQGMSQDPVETKDDEW